MGEPAASAAGGPAPAEADRGNRAEGTTLRREAADGLGPECRCRAGACWAGRAAAAPECRWRAEAAWAGRAAGRGRRCQAVMAVATPPAGITPVVTAEAGIV